MSDECKKPDIEQCQGLIEGICLNIRYLEGSWQYQIFNNLDELRFSLEETLSPAELNLFTQVLERTIKNPLRRQIGRLRAIAKSVDELNRYLR